MTAPRDRMASPGEARSIAALFLAAGAKPDEIDGAVMQLIEMTKDALRPPMSYQEVAQQAVDALRAYRQGSESVVEQAS